ncbi:MAG: hypothetical protein OXC63_00610 [Aestuariivita sp.]|nr:hypothetical protein [Aestuariivita sp.]
MSFRPRGSHRDRERATLRSPWRQTLFVLWFKAAGRHLPAVRGVVIPSARAVDCGGAGDRRYSDSVKTLAKAFSKRSNWCDFIEEQLGRC